MCGSIAFNSFHTEGTLILTPNSGNDVPLVNCELFSSRFVPTACVTPDLVRSPNTRALHSEKDPSSRNAETISHEIFTIWRP